MYTLVAGTPHESYADTGTVRPKSANVSGGQGGSQRNHGEVSSGKGKRQLGSSAGHVAYRAGRWSHTKTKRPMQILRITKSTGRSTIRSAHFRENWTAREPHSCDAVTRDNHTTYPFFPSRLSSFQLRCQDKFNWPGSRADYSHLFFALT